MGNMGWGVICRVVIIMGQGWLATWLDLQKICDEETAVA